MAVTVTLTDEQANWLVRHIESLESDWHWNSHSRPDSDSREHAATIKRKVAEGQRSSRWEGPGSR